MRFKLFSLIPAMTPIGLFAAAWNLTIVGYKSMGMELSNKELFPTLSRVTQNTMDGLAAATAEILIYHK